MSIEVGQRVRAASHTPQWGATGEVVAKGSWNCLWVVLLDSGETSTFLDHELVPINEAPPEEGWIGGTDAEDDEVQERRRESSE